MRSQIHHTRKQATARAETASILPSPIGDWRAAIPAVVLGVLLTVLACLLLAGCAPTNSPPEQVQAQNPTVTYKYRGDEELVRANEKAATFCSQYHSIPQTQDIRDSSDGSKTVVFDCVAAGPSDVTTVPYNANVPYTYHTDQELLQASRSAEIYCNNTGSGRAVATVVTDASGTKTVTFQCVP